MRTEKILKIGFWSIPGLIILIFFVMPYLITQLSWSWYFDEDTGVMGDTIGGITGPSIAFVAAIVTFMAFYIQYKANIIQEEGLKNQEAQIIKQQFESRFFELIKLHRDNVAEITLQNESGKKVFVTLIRELREIFKILKNLVIVHNVDLSKEELINLSYMSFFYGTGPNSNRVLKGAISEYHIGLINNLIKNLDDKDIKKAVKKNRNFKFTPFEGHQSRLGHYFRHLYQTIRYIDESKLDIDKYEYIKILRAQLSNHEQALLFFNSLSNLGSEWKDKGLIENYDFIKNIPKDFIDPVTEINVKEIYPKVKFEFEK
ncbi:putative phage abortive infection protein [Mucilaginibacter phyllosphaerae]